MPKDINGRELKVGDIVSFSGVVESISAGVESGKNISVFVDDVVVSLNSHGVSVEVVENKPAPASAEPAAPVPAAAEAAHPAVK